MFRSCLAAVLAVLVLAACSTSRHLSPARVSAATPTLPCTLPYGTRVALLSPHPGSAKVGAGDTTVVVAASRDLPKTATVVATDAKGDQVSGALERSTHAHAHSKAPFKSPVVYRARGVALRPGGHYTIALDDLAQNGCAPYVSLGDGARFST